MAISLRSNRLFEPAYRQAGSKNTDCKTELANFASPSVGSDPVKF